MTKTTAIAFALMTLSSAAQAHQIWIEPADQRAVIRFGEFGDNLREASPGLLDKFVAPSATLLSSKGEKSAAGVKTASGFALPFVATAGESVVAQDASYPLYAFKRADKDMANWYYPAARWITDFAAQPPKLPLDLVPTGDAGAFKLYFQGKPLPKTKVALVTQSGWAKEANTDEHGAVKFDMPWKGTYVAEVHHNDQTPGERMGAKGAERYTAVNYVTSVTYIKADGVEPLPAPPAATPSPAK